MAQDAQQTTAINVDEFVYFMRTVPLRCVRCGKEYFEIDNLGSWQCAQTVLSTTPIRPLTARSHDVLAQPTYIAADHKSDPVSPTWDHYDDVMISLHLATQLRSRVLSSFSILPLSLVNRPTSQSLVLDTSPARTGIAAVRRYDYISKNLATNSLGDGFTDAGSAPTNPALSHIRVQKYVNPMTLAHGMLVRPARGYAPYIHNAKTLRLLRRSGVVMRA